MHHAASGEGLNLPGLELVLLDRVAQPSISAIPYSMQFQQSDISNWAKNRITPTQDILFSSCVSKKDSLKVQYSNLKYSKAAEPPFGKGPSTPYAPCPL